VAIEEPGWMSMLPDGSAILADHASPIRITPGGAVQKIAAALSEKSERYSIMAV
jgi:hypothetical protein